MWESTAKVYRDAADVLDAHGWIQGEEGSVETGFCLYGALRHAVGATEEELAAHTWVGGDFLERVTLDSPRRFAMEKAWKVLRLHLRTNPAAWNDSMPRSRKDVTSMLRSLADRLVAEDAAMDEPVLSTVPAQVVHVDAGTEVLA